MRWTPAADEVLAELVDKGLTYRAIAEHLDETRDAVSGRAKRLGLRSKCAPSAKTAQLRAWPAPRRLGRTWTPAEDALIRQRICEGGNYHTIAREIGVSHATVASRAYNLGIRRDVEPERTRVDRFVCGHCNTRSDAPLDFGCAKCLPLRRVAA